VTGVRIFAQLVRAKKDHKCSRCGSAIGKGALHVMWRMRDLGYATERYCLKCASLEVREMLRYGVRALIIYVSGGEDYCITPVRNEPLGEELRRALESLIAK
jgi:hypothetical protein